MYDQLRFSQFDVGLHIIKVKQVIALIVADRQTNVKVILILFFLETSEFRRLYHA